jgi:hypothetical protein
LGSRQRRVLPLHALFASLIVVAVTAAVLNEVLERRVGGAHAGPCSRNCIWFEFVRTAPLVRSGLLELAGLVPDGELGDETLAVQMEPWNVEAGDLQAGAWNADQAGHVLGGEGRAGHLPTAASCRSVGPLTDLEMRRRDLQELLPLQEPAVLGFETAGVVDAIGGEPSGSVVGRSHS